MGGAATTTGTGLSYLLSHLFTVTFMTSAGYSYQSYESASRDKMITFRVAENVSLIAEHTTVSMPLKSYKECLVVRPRFSAFEPHTGKYEHIWATDNKILRSIYANIGVMLCSDGKNPDREITEHYYYVYPDPTLINGVTLDPRNKHNRPFVISLRGQNEWEKFKDSLNCYLTKNTEKNNNNNYKCMDPDKNIDYLFHKNIEFAEQLKTGFHTPRLMHLTGHSPGVYFDAVEFSEVDNTSTDELRTKHFLIDWTKDLFNMDTDVTEILFRDDTESQNE